MEPIDRREAAWTEFQKVWGELLESLQTPGSAILVEGERDRDSLLRLGVRAPIHLVHRGQSLSQLSHGLEGQVRRLIVLTDWDRSGGQLAQRVRELLEAGPVTVDLEFRRRVARALRGELVHVEGLAGWAQRLAERHAGSLEQLWDPEPVTRRPTG
ncbi:MAG: hypothetical protein L3K19_04590 [Thermoplasmata archaeon]|nr:hypothetical protein [Thermoplasmata archaeon]